MVYFKRIRDSLISGEIEQIEELTTTALQSGVSAEEILHQALVPGLDEVGRRFQNGEYFSRNYWYRERR